MNLNFVITFDILTNVYDILFQNRLKVTPLTSFVGSMSQKKKGVIRFYKHFFNYINFGFKSRARLGNWFTLPGCPMGLPLEKEKKLSQPVVIVILSLVLLTILFLSAAFNIISNPIFKWYFSPYISCMHFLFSHLVKYCYLAFQYRGEWGDPGQS